MTIVTPAGPRFFYAEAKITPYLLISTSFVAKLDVISETTIYYPTYGRFLNSRPLTVSLSV